MADSQKKIARDRRLEQLEQAVQQYALRKKERLEADVAFMQSVIDSRTGAGQLSSQSVFDASNLLAESINRFLEG